MRSLPPPPAGCTLEKGPSPGQIQHSSELQLTGLAGANIGVGVVSLAADCLAFEAFFFGDFWAAGFLAVDFLAELATFLRAGIVSNRDESSQAESEFHSHGLTKVPPRQSHNRPLMNRSRFNDLIRRSNVGADNYAF